MTKRKLDFLTSRRFWALVAISVVNVLVSETILAQEIGQALTILLAGFVGVRTVDRLGDCLKGNGGNSR